MSRFTMGVALGGAAVYFFDPLQGEDRRRRMQSLWRENHETANQVGAGVSRAAESMRPLVRRMKRGLEQRNWSEDAATSWGPALTGVLVASAVGGSLVYLLDPQNGPARRKRIVTFVGEKRSGLRQQIRNVQDAAETVRPRINGAVAGVSRMAEVAMARGN